MLENYLKQKLNDKNILLMTHAVVGYPSLEENWEMLECMQEAGVDLVELQLPFSEPIADGPLFVKANQVALECGMNLDKYFDFMSRASEAFDFQLLFMGYYNSVFRMQHEKFCDRLKQAGGAGFIIADLPPEQAQELNHYARSQGLDPIVLVTPVNDDERLEEIAGQGSGFIYCVSRTGVTGKKTDIGQDLHAYLQRCRAVTSLPIAVGFGIKEAEHIRLLKGQADIAIVGTACLEAWETGGEDNYLHFLKSLRDVA